MHSFHSNHDTRYYSHHNEWNYNFLLFCLFQIEQPKKCFFIFVLHKKKISITHLSDVTSITISMDYNILNQIIFFDVKLKKKCNNSSYISNRNHDIQYNGQSSLEENEKKTSCLWNSISKTNNRVCFNSFLKECQPVWCFFFKTFCKWSKKLNRNHDVFKEVKHLKMFLEIYLWKN